MAARAGKKVVIVKKVIKAIGQLTLHIGEPLFHYVLNHELTVFTLRGALVFGVSILRQKLF